MQHLKKRIKIFLTLRWAEQKSTFPTEFLTAVNFMDAPSTPSAHALPEPRLLAPSFSASFAFWSLRNNTKNGSFFGAEFQGMSMPRSMIVVNHPLIRFSFLSEMGWVGPLIKDHCSFFQGLRNHHYPLI